MLLNRPGGVGLCVLWNPTANWSLSWKKSRRLFLYAIWHDLDIFSSPYYCFAALWTKIIGYVSNIVFDLSKSNGAFLTALCTLRRQNWVQQKHCKRVKISMKTFLDFKFMWLSFTDFSVNRDIKTRPLFELFLASFGKIMVYVVQLVALLFLQSGVAAGPKRWPPPEMLEK